MGFYWKKDIMSIRQIFELCGSRIFKFRYAFCFSIIRQNSFEFELQQDKTHKMTYAPSEDTDQRGHAPSLVRSVQSDQILRCAL